MEEKEIYIYRFQMEMVEIVKSMRPQQWIKNLFIFAALIFSENIFNLSLLGRSIIAFVSFCLLSGALYVFNDIKDLEEDKLHPLKSKRPLASGKLRKSTATLSVVILIVIGFIFALGLGVNFLIVAVIYVVLQLAYSLFLKHVVILDVFIIALGFLIRVIAGGLAIQVYISPWLLVCMVLLALFLAMSKRRHELILLDENAIGHRSILKEYNPYLLDQMIAVVTASTVVAYCLYTVSAETMAKFGTTKMIFTVPFVLYGVFRYLYLVHRRAEGGSPETLIIKDKPLLIDIFLWIVAVFIIIYIKW